MITTFIGGTRSGKSIAAEQYVEHMSAPNSAVTYIATAHISDDDNFAKRIEQHRVRRNPAWRTFQTREPEEIFNAFDTDDIVLVDSLGTWLARFQDFKFDTDRFLETLKARQALTVIVTEEVGLSIHPRTQLGRDFIDALGELNQTIARYSDHFYFVCASRITELQAVPPWQKRRGTC